MWRKTVWLIATLTLSIFVAQVAAREGWARKPGRVRLIIPMNSQEADDFCAGVG
jgi:hypothetical protein